MSAMRNSASLETLQALARNYGVAIISTSMPAGLLGCYLPDRACVYLDRKLTPMEVRSVLAHELGHVHYGHAEAAGGDPEVWERQADAFAARLLIDCDEYASLERISDDASFLADSLDVTVSVIDAFRTLCLPRMGIVAR
ncbi:hypothetical protein GCM10027568_33120 [Humibacter soli]